MEIFDYGLWDIDFFEYHEIERPENEELGKMMSNGRLAKLEGELAMQKSFSEEVKKCQSELDDYLQELDEDVEGMQSTIYFLQQELKTTRDRIQFLEKENYQLKNGIIDDPEKRQQTFVVNGKMTSLLRTCEEKNESIENFENDERTKKSNSINYNIMHNNSNNNNNTVIVNNINSINNGNNNSSNNNNNNSNNILNEDIDLQANKNSDIHSSNELKNGDELNETIGNNSSNSAAVAAAVGGNCIKGTRQPPKKRSYDDSDSSENSSTNGINLHNKIVNKKTRRSSVLSIDLNEEDTQITEEEESEDDDNSQKILTRRKSSRILQSNDHN